MDAILPIALLLVFAVVMIGVVRTVSTPQRNNTATPQPVPSEKVSNSTPSPVHAKKTSSATHHRKKQNGVTPTRVRQENQKELA